MKRLLGLFAIHVIVWTGLILLIPGSDRIDYEHLGDASTPWVRQFIIALVAVFVLQCIVLTRGHLWREVFVEAPRARRLWMWLPPLLLLVAGTGALLRDGLSDAPASYWIGLTTTMVLVGITEELSFRGLLLVGARREWGSERVAVVFSSVLFGLFHLPNWLLGQDGLMTVRQVGATAVLGLVFYVLRRASGTLITCIVLHTVYDWLLIQGTFA